MKRLFLMALVLVAGLAAAAPTSWAQTPAPRPRVLAFFDTGGEIDHFFFASQAMRDFSAKANANGYSFSATSDWNALNDDSLRDVKVVIWLNGQPGNDAQRQAFQRYMERGGAWLGFHVSGFGPNGWTWFRDFMGGVGFGASNWPSLPARVNVDDAAHPAMRGVTPSFVAPINEWYSWNPSPRGNPAVKVLMTLDKSNFPLGVKNFLNGGDIPVAWSNTRFKMVYLNYGHGDRIYTGPELTRITDNSLAWLLSQQK
jgi:type 1 glutamine amidotransferase